MEKQNVKRTWIGVSIRKSAFGFLKIVHILFVKWNGFQKMQLWLSLLYIT